MPSREPVTAHLPAEGRLGAAATLLVLARSGERGWLEGRGAVEAVDRAATLRRGETEADRLTLFRLR